jgi:uridine phosphorylase
MRSRRICFIPIISLLALASNDRSLVAADRSAGAAAASSALNVLKKLDYRYFVAGGTCAAISHGITTPIDVVRAEAKSRDGEYGRFFASHFPFHVVSI